MNKIKLIAADNDQTMYDSYYPFPNRNRQALNELHKQGYLTCIASGRTVQQLDDVIKEWNLYFKPEFIIGVNGQSYYDGLVNKRVDSLVLSRDTVKEVTEKIVELGYHFHSYIDEYTIFDHQDEIFEHYKQMVYRDIRLANSMDDFLVGHTYKILLFFSKNEEAEIFKEKFQPTLDKFKDEIKFLRTTNETFEIVHAKTSKAFALEELCKKHNIDASEVMAFGDNDNDNEMLEFAGTSVCLKNGQDSTKELCDYVTDLNCKDGGFGDFIFKNILND